MKANFLKSLIAVAGIALVAFSSVTLQAAQNRKLDFTLVNKTGQVIEEVYVSPKNDDSWGEDVMGKDVLENNKSVDIEFSRSEKSCIWDLKVIVAGKGSVADRSIEWNELDLCKANEITLKYDNKKPTAFIK